MRQPDWLRGLEVVTGLAAIVPSVLVLADPGLGIASLIVILFVGLIIAGLKVRWLRTPGESRAGIPKHRDHAMPMKQD